MAIEPVTREERFLAAAGGQSVTSPTPITRKEQLLQGIIDAVKSGGATPDVIKDAVNDYLDANPVKPGATTEQAAQIEQNKNDIADLQTEVDELKESGGGSVDLTGVVRSVNGKTPDEKGNVEIDVSGSGENGDGLNEDTKRIILTLFQNAVFTSDQSGNIKALENLFLDLSVPATGIVLSAGSLTFAATIPKTLVATVSPIGATDAVSWSSSNPSIASVSQTGVVTPLADGDCTITATAGSFSASCAVTVSFSADALDITQDGDTLIIVSALSATQDGTALIID